MADSPGQTDHYRLSGVKVTEQVLGSGPYTSNIELEYMGLRCMGKKIHQALFMQGETADKVRQLKEQCHLLSQICHPNLAMFLGLYFQQSPILVMEFVPYNLASCIDQYGVLPNEVCYSILHDVAMGLAYLHGHIPAITHGELTASTILLTPNMTAKISYVGMTKILRLTQAEIRYMAKTSGTLKYMAPEVATSTTLYYDHSTDIYSYGILIVHTFTGEQTDSTVHQNNCEIENSNPLQEPAGHKLVINPNNPLKELIHSCTDENPQLRPNSDDVVRILTEMVKKFPTTFINRLDMMQEIQRLEMNRNVKESLEEKVQNLKQQVEVQRQELDNLKTENELFSQQIKADDELMSKIIEDIQQLWDPEPPSDSKNLQDLVPSETKEVKKLGSKGISIPHDNIDNDNQSIRGDIEQSPKPVNNMSDSAQETVTMKMHSLKHHTEQSPKPEKQKDLINNMSDSAQETVTMKMHSPKPVISPRKKAPPKQENSSPTIGEGGINTEKFSATNLPSRKLNAAAIDEPKSERNEISLVTMIGKGRFFEVWEGRWNGTKVAVKKLTEQFIPSEYIQDELHIVKSFHHPNVVQVYAARKTEKPLCLVEELVECGSLLDYLRGEGKALQFAQIVEKAEEIAAGMAYLEQHDYVHQNLSARNVMLSKDLVCKVSDYGVVRLIKAVDEECSIPMSLPKRTAPEAFLHGHFTIKSDVWSYGIVLYELVTYGHLPYMGMTNEQVMKQLQEGYRTPRPENCQEKFYEIMLSCWKDSPANRPTFETLRWQMEDYFCTDDDGYLYMKVKRASLVS